MKDYKTIDQYIKSFPKDMQVTLQSMRMTINKAIPGAEEAIRYGMPTFRLNDENLVHFAGYKTHIGFYPAPSAIVKFEKELSGYSTSKGCVRFPVNKQPPLALIGKITKFRLKESVKKAPKKSPSGNYTHYHADGSMWAKGKLTGKTMDGYWEWFRKDGTKMRSGTFDKGIQRGTWTTYDSKGKAYKVTEMKLTSVFEKISAPATRALENAKIKNLKDLSKWTEKELMSLHGIGPSAIPVLRKALKESKLSFKK